MVLTKRSAWAFKFGDRGGSFTDCIPESASMLRNSFVYSGSRSCIRYIDVKDESGNVTNWNIELGPPLVLRRAGWKQDSLKAGDQVTVAGYRAKDGSKMANGTKVTLPDGRQVFAGSTADGGPRP